MTAGLGWWTIHGEALLDALHRSHDGDDPDVVYAELYANSEHERPSERTPMCEARNPEGYGCTLDEGHEGYHQAGGSHPRRCWRNA